MDRSQDTILEQSEESSKPAEDDFAQQVQKLDYSPEFLLGEVRIEMWTHSQKPVKRPFYVSDQSKDCLFQYAYYQLLGHYLDESYDKPFLQGEWKTLDIKALIHDERPPQKHSVQDCNVHVRKLVLEPDRMYPETEKFLDLDFAELESYLDSNPEVCVGPLGRILIARKNKVSDWGRMAKSSYKQCPQVAVVWMRILAANILITESDDLKEELSKQLLHVYIYTLLHSGLFYFTKENRAGNHSSLLFNFGVILDTVISVRKLALEQCGSALSLFNRDTFDLFGLEAEVWNEPVLLDHILLYLSIELDRSQPSYQKGKYFLEHFVLSQTRNGLFGLFLGDLYELDNLFNTTEEPLTQHKVLESYLQGYKSGDEYVCMGSLSRLAVLYTGRWRAKLEESKEFCKQEPTQPDQATWNTWIQTMQDEYKQIFEVHRMLSQLGRYESMDFMLNHYYRCYSYPLGELENKARPQRDIENLIMNRKVSLELCKPYFNYFYVIGEKSPYLEDYFHLLHYLGYIEAGLVAFRIGTLLSEEEASLAKRVYYYAQCKAEGLGVETDPLYAAQIFHRNFLDECEQITSGQNFLALAIQLYNLVKLNPLQNIETNYFQFLMLAPQETKKNEHGNKGHPEAKSEKDLKEDRIQTCKFELGMYLVNLLFQAQEYKSRQPTKRYLFYTIQILKELKANKILKDIKANHAMEEQKANKSENSNLSKPSVTNQVNLEFEMLLVRLIKSSSGIRYTTNEDHYYQYLLEVEASQNLCTFQKMTALQRDSQFSGELSRMSGVHYNSHQASLKETLDLLDIICKLIVGANTFEVSRYSLEIDVMPKAEELLNHIRSAQKQSPIPVGRRTTHTRSIILPNKIDPTDLQNKQQKRSSSKKKLTVMARKESEVEHFGDSPLKFMRNLDDIGNKIAILSLKDEFKRRILKEGKIRLFSEEDLEEQEPQQPVELTFLAKITCKKMKFKTSGQHCQVFMLEFRSAEQFEDFFENLQFAYTWSAYFLNYYGVCVYEMTDSADKFSVGLISEPFERFGSDSSTSNIWASTSLSLKEKAVLLLDLIEAVKQLQTARIPHLMVVPSCYAIYRCSDNSTRLKLIVPFFASNWSAPDEHLSDPSPLTDLLHLPPHIYIFKNFPKIKSVAFKSEAPDSKQSVQLNADSWPLAVSFVEMTQSARFLSSTGEISRADEYVQVLANKSKLSSVMESELNNWRKVYRSRRMPYHEVQRMLSLKTQQRLSVSKTIEFLEMFIQKEILSPGDQSDNNQQDGILSSSSPMVSALLRLARASHPWEQPSGKDGFLGVKVDQTPGQKDLRAAGRDTLKTVVVLPLGLEYHGNVEFGQGRWWVLPHGNGVIRRGRKILVEGQFSQGLPNGQVTIYGDDGAKIELSIEDDKGAVKECSVSWSDGRFERGDLFQVLTQIERPGVGRGDNNLEQEFVTRMMISNLDHLTNLFLNNDKRRILQADLKNFLNSEKSREEESANDLMSNLARIVLGQTLDVINSTEKPKNVPVKEQSSSIFDNFFKTEEWGDEEESEAEKQQKSVLKPSKSRLATKSKANLAKFGRSDMPLAQQSYEAQVDMLKTYVDFLKEALHMFCPPGYKLLNDGSLERKRKNTRGPVNLNNMLNVVGSALAAPFAQEKPKKLKRAWDPFGNEYVFWREEGQELPDPTLGFVVRPTSYENYLSMKVYLPAQSSSTYFETNIFKHRLVDTLAPINSVVELLAADRRTAFVVETDLTGEQRAVKIQDKRVVSGTAISIRTNRVALYSPDKSNEINRGSLYLKEEEFIYEGEIKSGMMHGFGKLRSAKNSEPAFYEGCFRDDLPHGPGVFIESTQEREKFTGSFYNGVRVVGSLIGSKTSIKDGLFLPKKQVQTDLSPLRQAVRINQGSAVVIGRLTIAEKMISFGVHQDTIAQSSGFFKIKYPTGDQYQGYFNLGKRFGPFALTSAEGDTLVGKWLFQDVEPTADMFSLQGIVLWNNSSSKKFSKGIFKLNSRGEIEQGQYGVISNRDGSVYHGEIYNNKYEGAGKLTFPDKSYYEGYFREGMYHGWGERYLSRSNTHYKGQFDHGIVQGFGVLDSKGIVIKGYFLDGVCQIAYREDYHGKLDNKEIKNLVARTNYNPEGDTYEMEGACRAVLGDGDYVFEGDIRQGKIEGRGVLYRGEELVFEGLFRHGLFSVGRLVIDSKVIFSGEFERSSIASPGLKKDKDLVIEGTFQQFINADGRPDLSMNSICIVYNKLLRELKVGYFKDGKERDYFLVKKEPGKTGENSGSAGQHRGIGNLGRRNHAESGGLYARNKVSMNLPPISAPIFRMEYYNDGVLEKSEEFPAHTSFLI